MKSLALKLTGVLALTMAAQPALAAHVVVFAPRTEAYAYSSARQGPQFPASQAWYVNGSAVPGQQYSQEAGGSSAGGGSTNQTFAQTFQPGAAGGQPQTHNSYSSADLSLGILKASTLSTGPNSFGSASGTVKSQLEDTIFFTNTSGATRTVGFTYRFDGQLADPFGGNPGGNVALALSCGSNPTFGCNNGPNGTGDAIMFAKQNGDLALLPNGNPQKAESGWNYYFATNSNCFGENIFCGNFTSNLWDYGLNAPNAGGVVDGYIRAYLNIPTGLTSLGVRGSINLNCHSASTCDFGNTGKFGFDPLPGGVTFGSASGVFLTANAPGAVPEPATWAMMIIGFGAVGSIIRRRRTVSVA